MTTSSTEQSIQDLQDSRERRPSSILVLILAALVLATMSVPVGRAVKGNSSSPARVH